MAASERCEDNLCTSTTENNPPKALHLILRPYYDSLCKLIEAAGPQDMSNKLYAKGIVGSAAHRALDALGVSKARQSASIVDAFMLNLEGGSGTEMELITLETFLGVLANVNNSCRQKANEIAIAAGCPQPSVMSPSSPESSIKSSPTATSNFTVQNIVSKLQEHKFPEPYWRLLGTALKLRADWLDTFAADRKAGNPINQTNALLGLLSKWLQRDLDSSWEKLSIAVGKLDYTELSDELRSAQEIELTVSNIHEKLVEGEFAEANWIQLGTYLGVTPGCLKTLSATHEGNMAHGQALALTDVLDKWMRWDKESSWGKLADVLDKINFPKIAREIRTQFCT